MINVLYNALHLSGRFSGVRSTVEQLMKEAFTNPAEGVNFEALCPSDYHLHDPFCSSQKLTKINIDTSNRWQRIGYEHLLMNRYFRKMEKHILHCPSYILPWNWKGKYVVTIHDTIALDFPEYCSFANRAYFRMALPHSIRRADRIIAVSDTVRNDILRRYPDCSSKINVIYHGIDDIFRKAPTPEKQREVRLKYNLPEKYILFVGNIEPKKNIARLTEAFRNAVKHSGIPHSLVIAGRFAWKCEEIIQLKKQNEERIIFPGYIPQSDLPAVYASAGLFVFPSLYEGFGIPPLEAMACGTPVITSNAGALPETTGGNALTVDPLSVVSLENAILELLSDSDLRNRLVERGRMHIQSFRWKTSWEKTVNLYHSLIE